MATRLAIVQRILRHFNQQDEALAMLPVPMASTSTTVSGNLTIVDTKLSRSSTSDPNRVDKRFIEIVETVSSSPTIGTVAVIADAGYDSSSIITVAPDMGAVMQGGTDYLLYALGLSPTSVAQYINDTLRLTHGPHIWFPSKVPDANFESNDLTNWDDVGTATSTFDIESVEGTADFIFGERSISCTTSAVDSGFESEIFRVTENETLLVVAFANVSTAGSTGVVQVILKNATTGLGIRTVTVDETEFQEVRFQEAVPSGCETMDIQFVAESSGITFHISPPVIVQVQGWHSYPAPTWLTDPEAQILASMQLPQGRASTNADVYIALTNPPQAGPEYALYRSDNWLVPNQLMVQSVGNRPTYFVVKRAYDELTSLTSTTNCDEDYLTYKAISKIYADRGEERDERKWGLRAAEIARAKGYGTPGLRILQNPEVAV